VRVKTFMKFLMNPDLLNKFEEKDRKTVIKFRNYIFREFEWYLNPRERHIYQKYKREESERNETSLDN